MVYYASKPGSSLIMKNNINTADDMEMRDWADKFDTTKAKLKAAVNAIGPYAKDVETYLKRKTKGK